MLLPLLKPQPLPSPYPVVFCLSIPFKCYCGVAAIVASAVMPTVPRFPLCGSVMYLSPPFPPSPPPRLAGTSPLTYLSRPSLLYTARYTVGPYYVCGDHLDLPTLGTTASHLKQQLELSWSQQSCGNNFFPLVISCLELQRHFLEQSSTDVLPVG